MPASFAMATGSATDVGGARSSAVAAAPLRRILAFVRDWSFDHERPEDVEAMRTRLKGLGVELTILAATGVWSFDDGSVTDRACGDMARTALLLGVRTAGDVVYVIDGARIARYPHLASAALSSTLARALTSRPENV